MVNAQCVLEFCIPSRCSAVFTYTCLSVLTSLAITSLSLVIVVNIKLFGLFYIVFSKIIFGEMGTPRIGSCTRLCFYYILALMCGCMFLYLVCEIVVFPSHTLVRFVKMLSLNLFIDLWVSFVFDYQPLM